MRKRIFLGIDLLPGVKKALKGYTKSIPDVRWVETENLHVTLCFLGDIDDEDLPELFETVDLIASRNIPGELEFESIEPFKYMIWARVKANPKLKKLYTDLIQELRSTGLLRSLRTGFSPHVTLARSRGKSANDFKKVLLKNLNSPYTHVAVYESELSAGNPHYTALDAFELQNNE
jgi:RNA 2',3'-cyclic 3'-phosphodiesterase